MIISRSQKESDTRERIRKVSNFSCFTLEHTHPCFCCSIRTKFDIGPIPSTHLIHCVECSAMNCTHRLNGTTVPTASQGPRNSVRPFLFCTAFSCSVIVYFLSTFLLFKQQNITYKFIQSLHERICDRIKFTIYTLI